MFLGQAEDECPVSQDPLKRIYVQRDVTGLRWFDRGQELLFALRVTVENHPEGLEGQV